LIKAVRGVIERYGIDVDLRELAKEVLGNGPYLKLNEVITKVLKYSKSLRIKDRDLKLLKRVS